MKPTNLRIYFLVLLGVTSFAANAQDITSVDELFQTKYETPLSIDAESDLNRTDKDDDKEAKKKEKKVNPKIFYGIKTKRGYAKTGFGERTVVELFHYLKDKDYVGPDPYSRDFYWYDFKKKKIQTITLDERGEVELTWPVSPKQLEKYRQIKTEQPRKPGRNDPCWCGSGKKYKKCHLGRD